MRERSAEARLHMRARAVAPNTSSRVHVIVAYGAMMLIAAVVFGAVSARPF